MKNIYIVLLISLCISSFAQTTEEEKKYRARAERNFVLVIKDTTDFKQIQIKDKGIMVYGSENVTEFSHPEFILYWSEVKSFLKKAYNSDYYELIEWYNHHGPHKEEVPDYYSLVQIHENLPTSFENLRVALDPGHFASNFENALLEEKYLKVRGEEFGKSGTFFTYEAKDNWDCAYIVEDILDSLGVEVYKTRNHGRSAINIDFDKWYTEDFYADAEELVAMGEMPRKRQLWLMSEESTRADAFKYVYKYLDFTRRINGINDFGPDVTFIMHFNSEETNSRDEEGFTALTDKNYAMNFIPGGIMKGELAKQSDRIQALRLLLSLDIDESERLAEALIKRQVKELGVKALPEDNNLRHTKRSCVYTGVEGSYHRNLALTKGVKGVVVYGEPFYQDNKVVFPQLVNRDFKYKKIYTSELVYKTALTYVNSLRDLLEQNKIILLNKEKGL